MLAYTGVGSRKTPSAVLGRFVELGKELAETGYTLRSGGAEGADTAFENGASYMPKMIFLPWDGFNGRNHDDLDYIDCQKSNDYHIAERLARSIHPNPASLTQMAMKFHTRNIYQVMGGFLDSYSDFLVCWTPGGKPVGGTRTAIVLAEFLKVPVFNFGLREYTLEEILDH